MVSKYNIGDLVAYYDRDGDELVDTIELINVGKDGIYYNIHGDVVNEEDIVGIVYPEKMYSLEDIEKIIEWILS